MNPDTDDGIGIDPNAWQLVAAEAALLDALVDLRRATLTKREVAQRMGVTRRTVTLIESVTSDIRMSTLHRYARAVGARIEHTVNPFEPVTGDDEAAR